VDTKYGNSWCGWCSKEVHGLNGVGLSKNIKSERGNLLVIPDLRWQMAL
jgi:hypothetical protein